MGAWGRLTKPSAGKGILLLPSSAARAPAMFNSGANLNVVNALADAGFVLLAGDIGQPAGETTVGNSTSVTRTGQLKTYIQGSFAMPAASGKVGIFATSGGGLAALNYARANPTLVSCIGLGSVPTNVEQAHDEDNAGFAALIDGAYTNHAGYVAAMPAGNPHGTGNQTALAGIPIKMWNSSNDPYNCASMNAAYATLINNAGGTASTVSLGAVGHSITGIDAAQVAAFFQANA